MPHQQAGSEHMSHSLMRGPETPTPPSLGIQPILYNSYISSIRALELVLTPFPHFACPSVHLGAHPSSFPTCHSTHSPSVRPPSLVSRFARCARQIHHQSVSSKVQPRSCGSLSSSSSEGSCIASRAIRCHFAWPSFVRREASPAADR